MGPMPIMVNNFNKKSIAKTTIYMNINLKELEVWFVVGSQDLYGEETLRQVALHAEEIAHYLDTQAVIPVAVKYKPIVKNTDEIYATLAAANSEKKLYWGHYLDAYLFTCKDVDPRIKSVAKAIVASAYAVQPGYPVA